MEKRLDTLRQKEKVKITITAYRTRERPRFMSKKIIIGSFFVATFFFAGGAFLLVYTDSDRAYARENLIDTKEVAKMRAKNEAAKKAQIEERNKQIAETEKNLTDQKAQLIIQEAKAKADKEAQIAREAAIQAIAREVLGARKTNFDSIYLEAEKKYGVSRYLLEAVHYVETRQSDDTTRESSAGAQGPMQFMPSTFQAYAQDGDGDNQASISDVHDAIFTAAKNLSTNGVAGGNVEGALYNYNHSESYVNRVLDTARSLGFKG